MWSNYFIHDNILHSTHFELLSTISLDTPPDSWENFKSKIYKDRTLELSYTTSHGNFRDPNLNPISTENILEIYNTYNDLMLEYLKKLAPDKVMSYRYTELNLVSTGKDFKFPIHNDGLDKLLSVVIYLSPEKNNGTYLHSDEQGSDTLQIDWLQNRAFIFSRDQKTWHSYRGDGISTRLALVYNLRT
jgi:hypothetical protein